MHAVDELATYTRDAARVVASPAEVALLLRHAHQAGRLLSMTPPEPAGPGLVAVEVRLRPLPRRRWTTRRRIGWTAAAVALVVVLVVGLVQWVITHLAAVAAGLLLLGALAGTAKAKGVCPGIITHCRGCRH